MNNVQNLDAEAWDRAFAEQLKAEVEISARTQAEIAQSAGIHPNTLRRYMSGDRSISVVDLRKVLVQLPLSIEVFLARVDRRAKGI